MPKCNYCNKYFDGYYDWDNYVYKKDDKIYCCWSCYRQAIKNKKIKKNNFVTKQ